MQPLTIWSCCFTLFLIYSGSVSSAGNNPSSDWNKSPFNVSVPLVANSPVACGANTICFFSGVDPDTDAYNQQLHKFSTTAGWRHYLSGYSASPRKEHATAYRASNNTVYVHGGINSSGEILSDFWRWTFSPLVWTNLTSTVSGFVQKRSSHGMATLSDDRIILFGGINAAGVPLSDMWIYGTDNTWTQVLTTIPSQARAPFSFALTADFTLYILSTTGYLYSSSGNFNAWNPEAFLAQSPSYPVPPLAAVGNVLLFNSRDNVGTYMFEGGVGWIKLNTSITPAGSTQNIGFVSDGSNGGALYFNGYEVWSIKASGINSTGSSSVPDSSTTPSSSTYSTSGPTVLCPFKCFNKCVQSLAECEQYDPSKQCITAPNWFPCYKGALGYVCQSVPCISVCVGAQNVSCWNGECVTSRTQCSPVRACPDAAPFRCSDGSCADALTNCPAVDCVVPNVKCADGTCSPPGVSCPSYNGCGSTLPYQCPNGKCVTNVTECRCGAGWICFDGSCVVDKLMCRPPPPTQKPVEVELTIPVDQSNEVNVTLDSNYTQVLCKVILPVGSLTSYTSDDGENAIQIVRSVADSVLRQTRHPSWPANTDPLTNLLSPALALTLSGYEEKTVTFTVPITIQLSVYLPDNVDTSRICLAYITAEGQWKCEDDQLIFTSSEGAMTAIGKTSHYTDFALLLQENEESSDVPNDRKDESVDPKVYIIIFVIAGVVVIGGGIGAAIWMKKKKKKEDNDVNLATELEQQ